MADFTADESRRRRNVAIEADEGLSAEAAALRGRLYPELCTIAWERYLRFGRIGKPVKAAEIRLAMEWLAFEYDASWWLENGSTTPETLLDLAVLQAAIEARP